MKTICIAGNIGKDAVTRNTQSGDSVTSWSVAVEERRGQDKQTLWFDCSLWGKRGEALCQYLRKGDKVSVSGELSRREHEGKTYLTVNVSQVALQGGNRQDSQQESSGYDQRPAPRDLDDEIPF